MILLVFLLESCSTTKPVPSRINQLLIFPPITDIRIIIKGDNKVRDSILSSKVGEEIINLTKTIIPDSVNAVQLYTNEAQSQEIAKAFFKIIKACEGQETTIKVAKIPDILMHLIDSSNQDFGLCLVYQGFTRTEENQTNQYIIGRGVDFFSLGLINFTPIKSSGTMLCFIIDKKNKNIRYYQKISTEKRNPIEKMVIKSLLRHQIMSYYQLEK